MCSRFPAGLAWFVAKSNTSVKEPVDGARCASEAGGLVQRVHEAKLRSSFRQIKQHTMWVVYAFVYRYIITCMDSFNFFTTDMHLNTLLFDSIVISFGAELQGDFPGEANDCTSDRPLRQ